MEVKFDKEPKKGSKNAAKVYAPTHGRRKVTFAPADLNKRRSAQGLDNGTDYAPGKQPKGQIKPFTRFMLMVCAFIFAGMLLFVLSGYERISRAYQEINTINADIDTADLTINALNVAIECAVTIDQAQAWARAHSMQYPLQSQYVASGASVPISAPPAADAAGSDGGEGAGAEPDGAEPAQDTVPTATPETEPTETPVPGA